MVPKEGIEQIMPEEQDGSVRRRRRLDRSASANDIDDRGWTPLHIYASKGDLKGVCSLISYKRLLVMSFCEFSYENTIFNFGNWFVNMWNMVFQSKTI